MSKNRLRSMSYLGLLLLLGTLSTSSTLKARGNQAKEYIANVLELEGAYGKAEKGRLVFKEDEVVFESSLGKEREEWGYDHVKTIDVVRSRLLKITLVSGDHLKFTSFGSETFDSDLVQFLHDNVKSPVKIKSEL